MFSIGKSSKIEAVIGPETEIEGSIRTSESIRIDGKVKGNIHAATVIIGPTGAILGNVSANAVTVGGKVKGNISSASSLELLPSGQVLGDIRTSALSIADGACFEGSCQMMKADGQVIELDPDGDHDAHNGQKGLKVVSAGAKR